MTDPRFTRRQVLAGGIGGAAALGLASLGGTPTSGAETVRRAASVKAAGNDLSAIKHVVFLMHENRSFDHYFGTMGGVRGYDDATNRGAFTQAWPGGSQSTLLPFHMNTKKQLSECTNDLDHTWPAEHASWNGGAMDRFVSTHTSSRYEGALGINTMGYYTKPDLPFYYDLVKKFTICDNYFCSVLGPTHPNRLMAMTGSIDPAGVAGGPILVTNSAQTPFQWTCTWPTMPEVLQDNNVSWKVYNPYGPNYAPDAAYFFSKNMLLYFEQYKDPASPLHQNAFNYYGPNVVGGLTGGSVRITSPPMSPTTRCPRCRGSCLRRSTTSIHPLLRPGRVVLTAGRSTPCFQPRGLGEHGVVHHVRRERRVLRSRPTADRPAGHPRGVPDGLPAALDSRRRCRTHRARRA